MNRLVSRRSVLAGGGAVLAGATGVLPARAQLFGGGQPAAASQFRSVAVDVTTLLDRGGGASARALGGVMLAQMRKHFADRVTGNGRDPLLTARVTSLYFQIYSGADLRDLGFGSNDNISGDGIVSAGGRVLSSTHVLTELSPSYSGAYYTQGIDDARLTNISFQFVYWLRREMGL